MYHLVKQVLRLTEDELNTVRQPTSTDALYRSTHDFLPLSYSRSLHAPQFSVELRYQRRMDRRQLCVLESRTSAPHAADKGSGRSGARILL